MDLAQGPITQGKTLVIEIVKFKVSTFGILRSQSKLRLITILDTKYVIFKSNIEYRMPKYGYVMSLCFSYTGSSGYGGSGTYTPYSSTSAAGT